MPSLLTKRPLHPGRTRRELGRNDWPVICRAVAGKDTDPLPTRRAALAVALLLAGLIAIGLGASLWLNPSTMSLLTSLLTK